MIDSKIWALGAISIQVEVAEWRGDKITPHTYICRIKHAASEPDITTSPRTNPLEAERECVAAFIAHWEPRQGRKTHPGRSAFRKVAAGQEVKPEPRLTSALKTLMKPEPKRGRNPAKIGGSKPVDDYEY